MTAVKKISDEAKEGMREAVFADSFSYSNKPRFGLFSQAPSTAVGETNYFKPVKPRRNEDGDVITGPVDFKAGVLEYGSKGRVGGLKASYSTTAVGNPYQTAAVAGLRTIEKGGF